MVAGACVYDSKRVNWYCSQHTQFLTRPPADAKGSSYKFVKSGEHFEWIHRTGLYNLRADERQGPVSRTLLDSDLLLLWGQGLGEAIELWRGS